RVPIVAFVLLTANEAEGTMRSSIFIFLISTWVVVSGAAPAEARDEAVIRVRLYDYIGLPPEVLTDAQNLAAKFYSPIGLSIDWAPTFRPHGRKGGSREYGRLQDFTINLLNRSMAARTTWAPDALGAAVVDREGGGRIAYVLYDRLRDAAVASRWEVRDLLALVIAHELAHLLLPPNSHSSDGLMRSGWDVSELRHIRIDSLHFTPDQVALIRERVTEMVAAQ
ncbi:MAG TPA: hypothetical protein VKB34_22845, partial [Povalibacter sp.]|nr:hypothetical protein [Povalibacter sp.]